MARGTKCDHLFNIVLVGDSGVGKTCLLARFADDAFNDATLSTIGIDFKVHYTDIQDRVVKLVIWDTAGQEKFRTIVTSYYRGAHGVVLAYDTTNASSFDNLGYWLQEVKRHAGSSCRIMLVGTKAELTAQRAVSEEAVRAFADQHCGGANSYVVTSAKTDEGVDRAFLLLAEQIFRQTVTNSAPAVVRSITTIPSRSLLDAQTLERHPCSC